MTEYVLCFCRDEDHVLLICKAKPQWQRGLWNLPGGKIEEGETPAEAAIRELREEANLYAEQAVALGVIEGDDWKVHVMRCFGFWPSTARQMTDEEISWVSMSEAVRHPKVIPNLKLIIPLAALSVSDWRLQDGDPDPIPNFFVSL